MIIQNMHVIFSDRKELHNCRYDYNWRNCRPQISYFYVDLHYCCLKYVKISTSFPVIRSSYFLKYDAQIAANGVSGVYISKIFRGGMPPDPPRMSHAFGASFHDHSHDAGFATEIILAISAAVESEMGAPISVMISEVLSDTYFSTLTAS